MSVSRREEESLHCKKYFSSVYICRPRANIKAAIYRIAFSEAKRGGLLTTVMLHPRASKAIPVSRNDTR